MVTLDHTNGALYWDTACTKCDLCKSRRKVVVGTGDLPCHLMLVGEAPGRSEDLCGAPFIGPSGKLLREALDQARKIAKVPPLRTLITNVVACHPPENRNPTDREALACWPRLVRLYNAGKPLVLVLVGKQAARYVKKLPDNTCKIYQVHHPAYILRNGGTSGKDWPAYVRSWADILTAAHNACNQRRLVDNA